MRETQNGFRDCKKDDDGGTLYGAPDVAYSTAIFKEALKEAPKEVAGIAKDALSEDKKFSRGALATIEGFTNPSFWAANIYNLKNNKSSLQPQSLKDLVKSEKKRCENEIRDASKETLKQLDNHINMYVSLRVFAKNKEKRNR